MAQQLRGWWDVNIFVSSVLRRFRGWVLAVLAALFALGVWFAFVDFHAGSWLSFGAGCVGLVREIFPVAADWFRRPAATLRANHADLMLEMSGLRPSPEEARVGHEVLGPTTGSAEWVASSKQVDRWLRGCDLPLAVAPGCRVQLDETLRAHASELEEVLRCRFQESCNSHPARVFVNEPKVCLVDAPTPERSSLRVFQGGYYHSVVSNEMCARLLESWGPKPVTRFNGRKLFPATPNGDGNHTLKPLATSGLANHIGVSTLAVTLDRRLIIWNQGGGSQQSRDLLAPTGSGSCNWSDLQAIADSAGGPTLKSLLKCAMERELREECSIQTRADIRMDTRILGYFRWLRRGGKPEFVGVTRLDVTASDLQPCAREVNAPRDRGYQLDYSAQDARSTVESLRDLLKRDNLSVPLRMNAEVLMSVLSEEPDALSDLLWPQMPDNASG